MRRRSAQSAADVCAAVGVVSLAALLTIGCGRAPKRADPGSSAPRPAAAAGDPAAVGGAAGARRIVSLVPAVTEMLFAIGAGPRVVAVSSFDTYPPEVRLLPTVGALIDPDLERIITLKPDLVVIDPGQVELAGTLQKLGVSTFPHGLGGLDHVTSTILQLGALTRMEERARGLAGSIVARLGQVRRHVEGRGRPRTLLVFGREPGTLRNIYASGGVGFLHDLVELAGGRNVFSAVRREALQASTEAIIAAAPEVIIELRYGASVVPGRLEAERDSWLALASVPAVRDRRIYLLVGDELVVPGPRVAATAERFAQALHPDAK